MLASVSSWPHLYNCPIRVFVHYSNSVLHSSTMILVCCQKVRDAYISTRKQNFTRNTCLRLHWPVTLRRVEPNSIKSNCTIVIFHQYYSVGLLFICICIYIRCRLCFDLSLIIFNSHIQVKDCFSFWFETRICYFWMCDWSTHNII